MPLVPPIPTPLDLKELEGTAFMYRYLDSFKDEDAVAGSIGLPLHCPVARAINKEFKDRVISWVASTTEKESGKILLWRMSYLGHYYRRIDVSPHTTTNTNVPKVVPLVPALDLLVQLIDAYSIARGVGNVVTVGIVRDLLEQIEAAEKV